MSSPFSEEIIDPSHDVPGGVPVTNAFAIGFTPRSGSTLLARALLESGIAGAPGDYFAPHVRQAAAERWGDIPLRQYLDILLAHRTSPQGVFGFKVAWQSWIRVMDIGEMLKPIRWVWVRRRNVIAQAVSLEIARQTDQWNSWQSGVEKEPEYDFDAIHVHRRRLTANNQEWEHYFRDREITPLEVTYEDFAADYTGTLEGVFEFLQIDTSGVELPEPPFQKLASERNREWIRRYRTDLGDEARSES